MFEEEVKATIERLPEVLGTQLSDENTAQYIELWQTGAHLLANRLVDKRHFFRDVLLLSVKLNKRFDIDLVNSNRVRRIMLDAFVDKKFTPQTEAPVTPDKEKSSPSPQAPVDNEQSEKHTVIHSLLSELCRLSDDRGNTPGALKKEVQNYLETLEVPGRCRLIIERWASTEHFVGSFDRISDEDIKKVFTLIYTLYCHQVSHSDADKLFAMAVRKVEQIPEALQYPPRQFL